MCGIIGRVARSGDVVPALVEGLRRMEYRGYDSAGIAVIDGGELRVAKGMRPAESPAEAAERPRRGMSVPGHGRQRTSWRTCRPRTDLSALGGRSPSGT